MLSLMGALHNRANHWIEQGVFDDLSSFRELEERIDAIEEPLDRGDIFEIFVEALLETDPVKKSILDSAKWRIVGSPFVSQLCTLLLYFKSLNIAQTGDVPVDVFM